MRTIVVCGGRKFEDGDYVRSVLDEEHRQSRIGKIIEGGATGADQFAAFWAHERGVLRETVVAKWRAWGRMAGPMRNQKMLTECGPVDAVIAFPGGRGNADLVKRAERLGIPVYRRGVPGEAPE